MSRVRHARHFAEARRQFDVCLFGLARLCQLARPIMRRQGEGWIVNVGSMAGAFGEPLQTIINAYAYGYVWSRPAVPLATKSLAMIAMMAAQGRATELRVHVAGALTNGCTAEQIQEVLLLVALYCGIPAANEAHRVAAVRRESFGR